jgi:hypothetical protein
MDFFTIFITMNTMDIIFNNKVYHDDLFEELIWWCDTHGVPEDKVILGVGDDNVDGVTYFVITVNESLFGYLMYKEFDMTEKYGQDGWNRHIESDYNCMTA